MLSNIACGNRDDNAENTEQLHDRTDDILVHSDTLLTT